jgi:hypothetical protein
MKSLFAFSPRINGFMPAHITSYLLEVGSGAGRCSDGSLPLPGQFLINGSGSAGFSRDFEAMSSGMGAAKTGTH